MTDTAEGILQRIRDITSLTLAFLGQDLAYLEAHLVAA